MVIRNLLFNFLIHFKPLLIFFAIFTVLSLAYSSQSFARTRLENLRVEYKVNPIGVDVTKPRLSWEIISDTRAAMQTAYQIRAAETPASLQSGKKLLWDSGQVNSDQSNQVEYQGPPLRSGQRIYWQVRVWTDKDQASAWSQVAFWEMGLLDPSDWQADWIQADIDEDLSRSQPCPFLRKEFKLQQEVKSARAYVTCLGLYELQINGQKVGDQVLTPGWTSYNKRLQYQTFDITALLSKGNNAIGAVLGDGWYRGYSSWDMRRNFYGSQLALLLQIHITYSDGSTEIIGSDKTWKAATGPILASDLYNGEIYDARLEMPGWNKTGFNDTNWQPIRVIDHRKDILVASFGPPVRKIQEIKPIKIIKTPNGETVFDLGQNMVGWVRLKVKGPAGTIVTLKHAEVLDKAGNLYIENLRKAQQKIQYTLKGGNTEIYEPNFTFMGFRYVAIDGYPGQPDLETITGIVIHSDMPPAGNFSCSDSLINQLQHNIQWGQKGNFVDVPTDCPQRDERMGWTGDAQVFATTACFNFDAAGFYTKWLKDLAADQFEDGTVPHVIPDVLKAGASAAWADAAVIVPWTVYRNYGDKRILEQQYPSMKAWVEYMHRQAGDTYLWNKGGHFGDWLAFATNRSDYPGATTDKDLIATAYFAYSTQILHQVAAILNKKEEAQKYNDLFLKVRQAFQDEFITPNGRLTSHTQTAYSLALAFDLVPAAFRARTAERLAEDVQKFKHITTGFVGANLICPVLTDHGYLDLAYMLLNRKEYPSWLYPVTMGATTIWERWDGIKPDGSFQDPGMNSFNHYAYGAIGNWLYEVVAGLRINAQQPGYKHMIIHPRPGGGLTFASASHHAMYGKVESAWKIENGHFTLGVTIPANTRATVVLPSAQAAQVLESAKPLKIGNGILNFSQDLEGVKLELGSGIYNFKYPWQ